MWEVMGYNPVRENVFIVIGETCLSTFWIFLRIAIEDGVGVVVNHYDQEQSDEYLNKLTE